MAEFGLIICCSSKFISLRNFVFQVEEDEINDIDQWSTWPGYLALALRILIAIWFIYDLTKTFTVEVKCIMI